jgi:PAS domain S-box-containing protein
MKETLKNLGYTVPTIAISGELAIEKAGEFLPDIILMDIHLAGKMDGIEAANIIKNRYDIPVIYLTAYADVAILDRAKITEPYGYIIKPAGELALHSAIHMALYKHEMEGKLKESEEKYRTIANFTYDWESWIGPDGKYLYVSPSCERITGYCAEEFIDNPNLIVQITYPEDYPVVYNFYNKLWNNNRDIFQMDFRIITKNNEIRWISHHCLPVYTDKGVWLGRRESKRDITERKMADLALKQANLKLNLLNNITRHDVLNQITVIQGHLSIAMEDFTDPGLLKVMKKIYVAADTIRSQIAFTKDYQDIGIIAPGWYNVRDIIEKAARSFNFSKVKFAINIANLEIYADRMIEKVFYNLIDNALRHGEKTTKLEFTSSISADALTISCHDNGMGVPDEVKEKIFKREYFKNSGFGLYLSKEILSITCISITETGRSGEGATFEIRVPKNGYRIIDNFDKQGYLTT